VFYVVKRDGSARVLRNRRDNAVLVKDTVLLGMDQLLKLRKSRQEITSWLGLRLVDIHNSDVLAHHPDAAFSGSSSALKFNRRPLSHTATDGHIASHAVVFQHGLCGTVLIP
jgi:hypothetical protein